MTKYFLTSVSIEGFRGINNEGAPLTLKFAPGCVNSVYAPNAHGKSSIFDAISYCLCGDVPKLRDLPSSEQADSYYANRFHGTGEAVISLELEPDDGSDSVVVEVKRLANGTREVTSPTGHSEPEELLASLNTPFTLLDYQTFQRFIDDAPLARGRSFSGLLGLSQLSEMRRALELLSNRGSLSNDFQVAVAQERDSTLGARIERLQNQVSQDYQGLTGEVLVWERADDEIANSTLAALKQVALLSSHLEDVRLTDVDWDGAERLIRDAEQGDLQEELSGVRDQLSRVEGTLLAREKALLIGELRRAVTARQRLIEESTLSQTRNILEEAQALFASSAWEDEFSCVVCDSQSGESIREIVVRKLATLQAIGESEVQIANLWSGDARVGDYRNLVETNGSADERSRFERVSSAFRGGKADSGTLTNLANILIATFNKAKLAHEQLTARRAFLEKTLPPSLVALTEQVARAKSVADSLATLSTTRLAKQASSQEVQRIQRWMEFAQAAKDTFSAAEVRLSSRKTEALEESYQHLYQEITKNPDIVPLLKKTGTTEELALRLSKFYGLEDVSASTLLPESYKNALGISIFLTAAMQSDARPKFIVLDDVSSSFDAGHQFGLMESLRKSIKGASDGDGPQVILLSHDGLLEKYFDRVSNEEDWKHQRIQGMPPAGLVFVQSQDANRIRTQAEQLLNAGQTDSAGPLLRQYLEFMLQQIIRKVDIPVPYDFAVRSDKKQVQNSLDAINDAVDLHERAGDLVLSEKQVSDIKSLHVPAIVGNWLAHYSEGVPMSVTAHVLLSVLDSVDAFADCFKYECQCGGSVRSRYYRNLCSKHCDC